MHRRWILAQLMYYFQNTLKLGGFGGGLSVFRLNTLKSWGERCHKPTKYYFLDFFFNALFFFSSYAASQINRLETQKGISGAGGALAVVPTFCLWDF